MEAGDFCAEFGSGREDICATGGGVSGGEGVADGVDYRNGGVRRVSLEELKFGQCGIYSGIGEVADGAYRIVGAEAVGVAGISREYGCVRRGGTKWALVEEGGSGVGGWGRLLSFGSFSFRSFFWFWGGWRE